MTEHGYRVSAQMAGLIESPHLRIGNAAYFAGWMCRRCGDLRACKLREHHVARKAQKFDLPAPPVSGRLHLNTPNFNLLEEAVVGKFGKAFPRG